MPNNRFPRSSRLKRQRYIRALFARNRARNETLTVGSIRIRFQLVDKADEPQAPVQVGFAPSRKTSTKVVRNRIRRLLRETYRLNQHKLFNQFDSHNVNLIMMLMYQGPDKEASERIRRDLPSALQQLAEQLAP